MSSFVTNRTPPSHIDFVCSVVLVVCFGSMHHFCFMRLFVCGSLACWSRLDYGPLVLAWMLLYANFQFKIFKSQMMVIFEILPPSELIRYW